MRRPARRVRRRIRRHLRRKGKGKGGRRRLHGRGVASCISQLAADQIDDIFYGRGKGRANVVDAVLVKGRVDAEIREGKMVNL